MNFHKIMKISTLELTGVGSIMQLPEGIHMDRRTFKILFLFNLPQMLRGDALCLT